LHVCGGNGSTGDCLQARCLGLSFAENLNQCGLQKEASMIAALIIILAVVLAMIAFDMLRIGPGEGRFGIAIDLGPFQNVAERLLHSLRRSPPSTEHRRRDSR